MVNAKYYDIESLSNLFTLAELVDAEKPEDQKLFVFYLLDDPDILPLRWKEQARERIREKNGSFAGEITFFDLTETTPNVKLAHEFGMFLPYSGQKGYVNNPDIPNACRIKMVKDHFCGYPLMAEPGAVSTDPFRLVCDTDPAYDPKEHPYLFGYNSQNYDLTMLAFYFAYAWKIPATDDAGLKLSLTKDGKFALTAKGLRKFNDKLFSPEFIDSMPSALADTPNGPDYRRPAWQLRKNMLMTGRHLDVARLNEKQSKVGLKRLLGMLGYQILESDKLSGTDTRIATVDQFADLVAYNASDVLNLKNLFYHPLYQAQFELKRQLMQTYPEVVYQANKPDRNDPDRKVLSGGHMVRYDYTPNISPRTVRRDRLTIDASSAQFSTKALCPYGCIRDIPAVSFQYPAEEEVKKQQEEYAAGIRKTPPVKRRDVLSEAQEFFNEKFAAFPELRARFDVVVQYYRLIEGKNFDSSKNYLESYGKTKAWTFDEIARLAEDITGKAYDKDGNVIAAVKFSECGTALPYFDADGKETSCYVIFSTGGVHGAEYNKALYDSDRAKWKAAMDELATVKEMFGNDPVACRKARKFTLPDGREVDYNAYLRSGFKIADSQWTDLEKKEPELFTKDKKGFSLNKKYTYTSSGAANHEDFTSYYPNLLRRMWTFFNKGLGYDRYGEIFDQKSRYGKLMKDESLPKEKREHYRILREGTKLILNSASGAADAGFENNIRANNQIISMRIIGQLFSWRIGQAQALEGAAVPSTNTDGLYTFMEPEVNARILAAESADIGVEIESEPMYLITKDSNNRIEMNAAAGKILSASGGTLGCHGGPAPSRALSHPAVIDRALAQYLVYAAKKERGAAMDAPFDRKLGELVLRNMCRKFEPVKCLLMFQNIIASSPSSHTYIFGETDEVDDPVILQHYNRIFYVTDDTPGTLHLSSASARKITPAMKEAREKRGEQPNVMESKACDVLEANGEDLNRLLSEDRDIVVQKCTNIEPEWDVLVENHDLHAMGKEQWKMIIESLDMGRYVDLLSDAFENSWRNRIPQ